MSAYIKRTERSQINDLTLHLKLIEKQEQAKPKSRRRREIIKIRGEINEIETKKTYKESKKQKAASLKKINKIDKPLANLSKMRRENTQINKIRNQKERQQTSGKYMESSKTNLKTYISKNLKILKRWTNF
jgi:hypothetical protein